MTKLFKRKTSIFILFLSFFMLISWSNTFAISKKDRIYGKDRIETSIKISKSGWKNGSDYVFIVQGYDFADALTVAPFAKKLNGPIILSGKERLKQETVDEITRLNPKKIFILGGEKVISNEVEVQLKNINVNNIERIYGQTRYETALKVAEKLGGAKELFIVNGYAYADALSISSIAAQKGAPIIYTNGNEISREIKNYMIKNNIENAYAIGGVGVISENAISGIENIERVSGLNRYLTNKNVLLKFDKDIKYEKIYFTTGEDFPDALAISTLAAFTKSPIVLTNKEINTELNTYVNSKLEDKSELIAIGGEKIVPENVLDKITNSKIEEDKGNGGNDAGGSGIGGDNNLNTEVKQGEFKLLVTTDGNEIVNKNLKILDKKSVMYYLRENAKVKDKNGFICEINGIKRKEFNELTEKEIKDGYLSADWFIYVNGKRANVGANDIRIKEKDTINVAYEKWDYTSLVSPGEKPKLNVSGIPNEVKANECFNVNVDLSVGKVYGASIKINGVEVATTDTKGQAVIKINKVGKHVITVEKYGSIYKKDINVKESNQDGNTSGEGTSTGKDEVIFRKVQENVIFEVRGNNEKVNFQIKDSSKNDSVVTIKVLDEKNSLVYIDQVSLNNGKYTLRTELDKGKYKGVCKVNKTPINFEFNIN